MAMMIQETEICTICERECLKSRMQELNTGRRKFYICFDCYRHADRDIIVILSRKKAMKEQSK